MAQYLELYYRVLGRVRIEQPSQPAPTSPSDQELEDFWEAVDIMFEEAPPVFRFEDTEPSPDQ